MTQTAPCTWLVDYSAFPGGLPPEPLASMPASGRAVVEQIAVNYLWRWTGKVLGTCETTIRPMRTDCFDEASSFWGMGPYGSGPYGIGGGFPWRPVIIDGLWWNIECGQCGPRCSCDYVSAITLPGPVASVDAVTIDGVPLDPTAYRVDNGNLLTRQDGAHWPRCNKWGVPEGEDGTWEVTYERGVPVPIDGQVAAGVMAVELAKAFTGAKDCALPQRIQSVSRQGVTLAVIDSMDDVAEGHTGIWLIDSWVSSMTKAPRVSRVYSPDLRRPRRTTWRAGQ